MWLPVRMRENIRPTADTMIVGGSCERVSLASGSPTMKAQNDFNRNYFQSLISYVTIGSDGTVGVRTKTDTTVKEDKQDG